MNPIRRIGDVRSFLGFHPAFLDTATFSIHLLGEVVTVKGTLVPGFERNGFFYTFPAVVRAAAEWPSTIG